MITDYLCHHCFQRLTCCKSGCFMYLPFTVREWCRPNSWQRQVRRKQWLDYPAVKKFRWYGIWAAVLRQHQHVTDGQMDR